MDEGGRVTIGIEEEGRMMAMGETKNAREEKGIRKAALFLASLGEEEIRRILAELEPERVALIRRELASLTEMDRTERDRIFSDFLTAAEDSRTGETVADDGKAKKIVTESILNPTAEKVEASEEEETLANRLVSERPQTIAALLKRLPENEARELVSSWSDSFRADVWKRMEQSGSVDDETGRILDEWFGAPLSSNRDIVSPTDEGSLRVDLPHPDPSPWALGRVSVPDILKKP